MALKRENLGDAENYHRKALSLKERLAKQDPSNHGWKVGISASSERLGEALAAAGRYEEAAPCFERSLEIAERIADADPDRFSAKAWTDLADTLGRIGKFEKQRNRPADARKYFERAAEILRDFQAEKRLTHEQEQSLKKLEEELKA